MTSMIILVVTGLKGFQCYEMQVKKNFNSGGGALKSKCRSYPTFRFSPGIALSKITEHCTRIHKQLIYIFNILNK